MLPSTVLPLSFSVQDDSQRQLLAEWKLEQKHVCLFRESSERLSFSLEGPLAQPKYPSWCVR